jgi:hypothetical protein
VTGSDHPARPAPAFRDRIAWGDFAAPSLRDVAEEARWLGDPPIAVVATVASMSGGASGLLMTPLGPREDYAALIIDWLADISTSGVLRVPSSLRPYFGSLRALAVPMRSSSWIVGVIALPMRPGWGPVARELEGLGSDFAARFESAHRRAETVYGRFASVGKRPAGRRTEPLTTPHAPERLLRGSSPPRGRDARHVEGTRRPETTGFVLGRDGSLALGRR